MTACKQTASTGAAATDEADSKSAAKSDGVEERKPSTKCRKGKKAKGKLAVKSNGAEKPKTHDLSDVTLGLAVMSIAEDETLALLTYQNQFWMRHFKDVCDRPSVDAIRKQAAENWKFFNDSDKAPYVAKARVLKIGRARIAEFKKKLMLTEEMTNKMVNLKM
ncbi:DNA-binding protein MNB1B-like [Triticum dicoccoides]|uniref:DNA-binding protein MNB1B-like n=1 Tax=Triticum dicoccoides TaxID=85692 RepID=UPI00188DDAB9|nr:DNA-binding protein MNB1B-like [Triticum dicoccoides]XP_037486005.1 DNA-binding protein MNB1B-like [Triticum dicoccoides]XP_037486007.1 DNA-binding protein MNB1B-like [Triticum dicoccoides]